MTVEFLEWWEKEMNPAPQLYDIDEVTLTAAMTHNFSSLSTTFIPPILRFRKKEWTGNGIDGGLAENIVVLISEEETRGVFTEALRMLKAASASTMEDVKVYHPKDYRGCESAQVMCVGLEDSWVVEGISRATRTLFIVDGGNHPAARTRMGLWRQMERDGLLIHCSQAASVAILSQQDWRALNTKITPDLPTIFNIFKYGASVISKKLLLCRSLWGQLWRKTQGERHRLKKDSYSNKDFFLADSDRLIHGGKEKIHILYLGGKNPRVSAYEWDEVLHIPDPYLIHATTGVVIGDSLFLLGGEGDPQGAHRLDLGSETWTTLSPMKAMRKNAGSVMWDPHTILMLGGWDPEARKCLSSCEYLDTRTKQWSLFPCDIPAPISAHAATLHKDHVYISGGSDGTETRGDGWRYSVTRRGEWELLPSLSKKRSFHGMVEDSSGGLSVIGGSFRLGLESTEVLETETLPTDEEGWVIQEKLPFEALVMAKEMK
ncbi:unnamed protein product [Darwinula stevensoni]|uniref:Uncharacterized protein n=1 Tax=Darwinula stevensoni TaxID=69355 RepID=A0A7R9A7M5_9CRUS|nr:unnamed protein product [Darwinula stevensoni]CAG0892573.1 unnamed protein product [Darwinula stevensoni]